MLLAEGVFIQLIPLLDREINAVLERFITGEEIVINELTSLYAISFLILAIYVMLNRLSDYQGTMINLSTYLQIFRSGVEKLIYHDIEYLNQESGSKRLQQVNRASRILAEMFTGAFSALTRNVVKAIGSLILITTVSWQVTLGVILTIAIYTVIHTIRFRKDRVYSKQKHEVTDKEYPRYWEVIPQAKLTKLFTNEEYELARIDKLRDFEFSIANKRQKLWVIADIVHLILVRGLTVGVKFYAAYLALQGAYGLATFVLLYALINRAQEPFWVLNWFMWQLQETYIQAGKYLKIMDTDEKVTESEGTLNDVELEGDIEFRNVEFRYADAKEPVFANLNLDFKKDQFTALVGKSGAGKSTIVNLICRFFDPTEGTITIGGTNISKITKKQLREKIGFIFQESYVFSGSILENMRYGRMDATEEEVITALRQANAWDFVSKFDKKLETKIGERGIKLSGGQKQRLAIARTLLKDPEILILDEATNALDSESEVQVQVALEKFMKGRTVIAIAHRLSTIKNADNIYVIGDGNVIESGNHKQLISIEKGIYRQLFDIQSGKFESQVQLLKEYEMM